MGDPVDRNSSESEVYENGLGVRKIVGRHQKIDVTVGTESAAFVQPLGEDRTSEQNAPHAGGSESADYLGRDRIQSQTEPGIEEPLVGCGRYAAHCTDDIVPIDGFITCGRFDHLST